MVWRAPGRRRRVAPPGRGPANRATPGSSTDASRTPRAPTRHWTARAVAPLDFVALQVRDIERSAAFYQEHLRLARAPHAPEHAVVFDTHPIPFAVREPVPGVDLDAAIPRPGVGVAVWFHVDDADQLHQALRQAEVPIVAEPIDGPFGRTFSITDPDGYVVTIHDKA